MSDDIKPEDGIADGIAAIPENFPHLPQPTKEELSPDSPAAFEQTALALGVDLEHQRARNDLNRLLRAENLEVHVHRIVKSFLWVVCSLTIMGIVVFAYHMLTPPKLHALEPDQVENIKSMLFSGGMGAAVSFIAQRYLSK